MKPPTSRTIEAFREIVWEHYRAHGRTMPWREDPTPYKVLVSELMLQQTQVSRVIPKFDAFLYTCPNIASLAEKSFAEVLGLWSGLGYNRRAKYLHQTAQLVVRDHGGVLPWGVSELVQLPGIGKNTAGAIMAYAFEQPVVFVETNIRTVYFHHFFPATDRLVSDRQIERLVELTMDREQPREWYWALMDYGAFLKKTAGGRLQTSRHYVKQSALSGSARQMRGQILKQLITGGVSRGELYRHVEGDERFDPAVDALVREGFVEIYGDVIRLKGQSETS